jgi:putative Mn2+ efflux pump MntP
LIAILLVSLGLAMDAFAVSLSTGVAARSFRPERALRMATSFGCFQAFMPVVGWLGGLGLTGLVSGFDHWVAFGLLGAIGGKMVVEAMKGKPTEKQLDRLSLGVLLVLSVATSIDALAVGFSFAVLRAPIVAPAAIIGVVTFVISFVGVGIGSRCGKLLESKAEVVGGLVLVGIGVRILVEHLARGITSGVV